MAEQHAREVESRLRNGSYRKLCKQMYVDRPAWSPGLNGLDRERAIINILTRMRYCTPRGRIAFAEKNAPGTQQHGLYPWNEGPGRADIGRASGRERGDHNG